MLVIILLSYKKNYVVIYELEGLNRQYLLQVFLFLEHFCQTTVHKHPTVQVFFLYMVSEKFYNLYQAIYYIFFISFGQLNLTTSSDGIPIDP